MGRLPVIRIQAGFKNCLNIPEIKTVKIHKSSTKLSMYSRIFFTHDQLKPYIIVIVQ